MREITRLKRIEKSILTAFFNTASIIKKGTTNFFSFFLNVGNQKVTIMLIPHSEKKVFNLRVNVFLLTLAIVASLTLMSGIFYLTFDNWKKSEAYFYASKQAQSNQKDKREYENLLNDIFDSHKTYKTKLNTLLSKLNSPTIRTMQENYHYNSGIGGGELNRSFEGEKLTNLEYNQVESRDLLQDYRYSISAFNEINKMVGNYQKILKDLPFGTPVRGFYTITSTFGLRIHPVYKVLDHHQGIDLAHERGTPLQATAPGIIESVKYNARGYGWNIIIRHKLGYSTRYAHMNSQPLVKAGEYVKKNQIIGYMGKSGVTTGVHLHYEVLLANKPVDPWTYISVR